jgi:hypothetical protein
MGSLSYVAADIREVIPEIVVVKPGSVGDKPRRVQMFRQHDLRTIRATLGLSVAECWSTKK